jgi:hypothetical protein
MKEAERHDRIVEYLRIKPISHGQVHTFQIAIPKSEVIEIPLERRENLEKSLSQQGSNLIPLIVRRTEAYSEEEEYELVYGADWCLAAKELDIEKLWVWVFDMTDEQAAAAKEEMQQLLSSSDSSPVVVQPPSPGTESNKPIVQMLDKLFQQVESLTQKVEQLTASVKRIESSESKQTAIDDKLVQQITEVVKGIFEEFLTNQKEILPAKTKPTGYEANTVKQLKDIAKERGVKITSKMTKDAIIEALKLSEKN